MRINGLATKAADSAALLKQPVDVVEAGPQPVGHGHSHGPIGKKPGYSR